MQEVSLCRPRGACGGYLEATVVHFLEEAEGATRLVMAVRVAALDGNLFGVEFDVAATGAVELSSSDGAYGCRGRGAHCDRVWTRKSLTAMWL